MRWPTSPPPQIQFNVVALSITRNHWMEIGLFRFDEDAISLLLRHLLDLINCCASTQWEREFPLNGKTCSVTLTNTTHHSNNNQFKRPHYPTLQWWFPLQQTNTRSSSWRINWKRFLQWIIRVKCGHFCLKVSKQSSACLRLELSVRLSCL